MCLLLFSYKTHPRYQLILAANRDEFYDRPTEAVDFWKDAPEVLAGRDLLAGGTWFGMTRTGRLAAITNFRDPANHRADAPSRGLLVSRYLLGREKPRSYLEGLAGDSKSYNGFSLLIGDTEELFYFSNRDGRIRLLSPGVYGLSNHFLDTPWPKIKKGKNALSQLLEDGRRPNAGDFFALLADQVPPEESELPNTGVGREWERVLGTLFISSPGYGTRSSTVVFIDDENKVDLRERVFNAHPEPIGERHFEFNIEAPDQRTY